MSNNSTENVSELSIALECVKQLIRCDNYQDIVAVLLTACEYFKLYSWVQVRLPDRTINESAKHNKNEHPDEHFADIIDLSLELGRIVIDIDGYIINDEDLSIYIQPIFVDIDDAELTETIDHVAMILDVAQETFNKLITIQTSKILHVEKAQAEEANKIKSAFLANVSHELRTPLHAIINYAKLSTRDCQKQQFDKAEQGLNIISESANRLLNLINDILDLSKLESGKLEFNFQLSCCKSLIDKAIAEIQPLLNDKKITIDKQFHDLPQVALDQNRFYQVLINIMSNAIKYSPVGKPITVKVKAKKMTHGRRASDLKGEPAIWITISDKGSGVPEDEISKIFEKFTQSKSKYQSGGTGLGLAISRDIIEAHNGRIWAENNSFGGLSVKIVIPVKQK